MKSKDILYSKGQNDECYTPRYAVLPLLKYIPVGKIIWCPFDTEESEYVKVLKEYGHRVVYFHISQGQNFYTYEPDEWDIMISNPPFTNKRKTFLRALSFGKPFALLMSNTWLNDSAPKQIFGNNLELLMFWERVKFMNNGVIQNKITFSSSYYCYNFLPRPILCESLKPYMKEE